MIYFLGITTLDSFIKLILNNFKKRGLIMTYGKLIKNKIQNVFGGLFDSLSIERKLNDAQMECIQFIICDYAPRQVKEIPFFHF
tara:strand:+ start:197 stop:448 length:252 start_codon:yes stop_codon:yes gene_type:complete